MPAPPPIQPLSKSNSSAVAEQPVRGEVAHLRRQEDGINRRLRPTSWDDAKRAIIPLFDMAMRDDANEKSMLAGLRASCLNEPLWAIKETVFAFVTGRIGEGFCPDGARFGIALRRLTDPLREKGVRLERERRAAERLDEEATTSGPVSAEARAAVDAAVKRMRAVSDEIRDDMLRGASAAPSPGYATRVAAATDARRAAKQEAGEQR